MAVTEMPPAGATRRSAGDPSIRSGAQNAPVPNEPEGGRGNAAAVAADPNPGPPTARPNERASAAAQAESDGVAAAAALASTDGAEGAADAHDADVDDEPSARMLARIRATMNPRNCRRNTKAPGTFYKQGKENERFLFWLWSHHPAVLVPHFRAALDRVRDSVVYPPRMLRMREDDDELRAKKTAWMAVFREARIRERIKAALGEGGTTWRSNVGAFSACQRNKNQKVAELRRHVLADGIARDAEGEKEEEEGEGEQGDDSKAAEGG